MIDRLLSSAEYEAFVRAISGQPFDRNRFNKADGKIRRGCGLRPEGLSILGRDDIPNLPKEFRVDKEWSQALVDRHQQAIRAAWKLYWRAMDVPAGAEVVVSEQDTIPLYGSHAVNREFFDEGVSFPVWAKPLLLGYNEIAKESAKASRAAINSGCLDDRQTAIWWEAMASAVEACLSIIASECDVLEVPLPPAGYGSGVRPPPATAGFDWQPITDGEYPPVNEWIMTKCADKSWPDIRSNQLRRANDGSCYVWASGDDFSDITHWAPLPADERKE